mmetsp:Transcript_1103/g.2552  ORF Transcript_1103/g.2552 Transcript_1103/m.2552 type:complete len:209 (-) Transcript_1103:196-822(-)
MHNIHVDRDPEASDQARGRDHESFHSVLLLKCRHPHTRPAPPQQHDIGKVLPLGVPPPVDVVFFQHVRHTLRQLVDQHCRERRLPRLVQGLALPQRQVVLKGIRPRDVVRQPLPPHPQPAPVLRGVLERDRVVRERGHAQPGEVLAQLRPYTLEVPVSAARGDHPSCALNRGEVALEGDVPRQHVEPRAHRLESPPPPVVLARVVPEH